MEYAFYVMVGTAAEFLVRASTWIPVGIFASGVLVGWIIWGGK